METQTFPKVCGEAMGSFIPRTLSLWSWGRWGWCLSDGACVDVHAGVVTPGQLNWAALSPMLDAQLPEKEASTAISPHMHRVLYTPNGDLGTRLSQGACEGGDRKVLVRHHWAPLVPPNSAMSGQLWPPGFWMLGHVHWDRSLLSTSEAWAYDPQPSLPRLSPSPTYGCLSEDKTV